MRQLMGKELLSLSRLRRVLSGTENNVLPEREGTRLYRRGGFVRARIGMDANAAEVPAEARLEERA
jgi:hypothetical protein